MVSIYAGADLGFVAWAQKELVAAAIVPPSKKVPEGEAGRQGRAGLAMIMKWIRREVVVILGRSDTIVAPQCSRGMESKLKRSFPID